MSTKFSKEDIGKEVIFRTGKKDNHQFLHGEYLGNLDDKHLIKILVFDGPYAGSIQVITDRLVKHLPPHDYDSTII